MAKTMVTGFVVCLRNEGAGDLEIRKVYSVIADTEASSKGLIRVVDESGGDYPYPEEFFAWIEVPDRAVKELLNSSAKR